MVGALAGPRAEGGHGRAADGGLLHAARARHEHPRAQRTALARLARRVRALRRAHVQLADGGVQEDPLSLAGCHRLPPAGTTAADPRDRRVVARPRRGHGARAGAPRPQSVGSALGRAQPVRATAAAHGDVRPAGPGRHAGFEQHGPADAVPVRPLSRRPGIRRAGLDPARRAGRGGTRAPRGLPVWHRLPGMRGTARAAAAPSSRIGTASSTRRRSRPRTLPARCSSGGSRGDARRARAG